MNQDQSKNVKEFDSEKKAPVRNLLHQEPDTPLFLRDGSDGEKGDAMDEKDKSEE